jgi:hypothetical protein
MLKFIEKNQSLVIWGGGALLVLYVLKKYFNQAADSTLVQGLKNPLDALGALAGSVVGIEPNIQGGTQLTENLSYYIELNGGIDKYLQQKQAGTFKGEPYDAAIDYKKQLQNKSLFPFFL